MTTRDRLAEAFRNVDKAVRDFTEAWLSLSTETKEAIRRLDKGGVQSPRAGEGE